jgi:hypothetical protein
MENKKARLALGIVLLILGIAAAVFLIKEFVIDKPKIPETEYESVYTEEDGTDAATIDREEAAQEMGLSVEMPDEMKQRIPDQKTLKKELENYLIDQGFWSDVKVAKSDGTMTEDFNQGIQILTFNLDNPGKTKVDVTIHTKENTYDFNFR